MTQDQQQPREQATPPIQCSFCMKGRDACKRLISGPGNIYICAECVELSAAICGVSDDETAELRGLRARVTELEAERDRMLPIYTAHLEQEQIAATYRDRERLRVASLTEHELHCEQRHPDYEYATTENARKSGDSPKPEGEGWEPNDIVLITNGLRGPDNPPQYRNWERYELTETNYWRRRTPAKEA
jgi:hypothetical protein